MQSAARFFDGDRYLRTVVADKPPTQSAAEALGAARLAGCRRGALILDACARTHDTALGARCPA